MKSPLQKLELTWIGKGQEFQLEPRILLEQPELAAGDPQAENMLIHGDNLLALKALEQDFAGRIKCIYIDPPFNTGAAFEHYDDGVEHSIWLNLMNARFKMLHSLLHNDGVLFVHLDDSEAAYCKVLLDEIFGRSNYVNHIINSTNKPFGFKSTADGLFKQANHIFFYAKNKVNLQLNYRALFLEKDYDAQYKFVFKDRSLPEAQWEWDNINEVVAKNLGYNNARIARKELGDALDIEVAQFAIQNSENVFRTASVSGGALLKRKETIARSKQSKDKIIRHPNDDMDYMFIGGERVLFYKERLREIDGFSLPGEIITDIWSDISIEGLAKEGGIDFPKGKKPEKLIQRCIELTTQEGDWVLDSFLGSGTTAAVATKLNRRWVGIELGQQAYTHCLPRLRQVVAGTDQSGISRAVGWAGGGGFRFFTLAPSLLNRDQYGHWVISPQYNAQMLAAALAKQEGFRYQPDPHTYWKQARSSEHDFLFTTTQFVTVQALDQLAAQLRPDESLLIACKSYQPECAGHHPRITLKKIPQLLLGRCEFGRDDYSLHIVPAPPAAEAAPAEEDAATPDAPAAAPAPVQGQLF